MYVIPLAYFGLPDPSSKKSAKIIFNSHKNHKNIIFVNITLLFDAHKQLPSK